MHRLRVPVVSKENFQNPRTGTQISTPPPALLSPLLLSSPPSPVPLGRRLSRRQDLNFVWANLTTKPINKTIHTVPSTATIRTVRNLTSIIT